MFWLYAIVVIGGVIAAGGLWLKCGAIANRISTGLTRTPPSRAERIGAYILGPIAIVALHMIPKKPY